MRLEPFRIFRVVGALVALALACSLSGCATWNDTRDSSKLYDEPALFVDEHVDQLLTGTCRPAGKANKGAATPPESDQRQEDCLKFVAKEKSFRDMSREASANPENLVVVRHYLKSGVALGDIYCNRYFDDISRYSKHQKFFRSQANDTGGFITALMTIFKASATTIGASSAFFTVLDSTAQNYDFAYIVAPDLERVRRLVQNTQESMYQDQKDKIVDYYDAQRFLVRYANNCTFNGIRSLINEAVDNNARDPGDAKGSSAAGK